MPTPFEVCTIAYRGEQMLELTTAKVRLIATTQRGPRLAHFGTRDGANLLFWEPGKIRRGQWDLMGGHRLWVTRPQADEAEETYLADNSPCEVNRSANGFTVSGALDPIARTTRGFTIAVTAEDTIVIDHFVRNDGQMLFSGGAWTLTCTSPEADTKYIVPLGDDSSWNTATITLYKTWGGLAGGFEDPQFAVEGDLFVLSPGGQQNKRMLRADAGIMAMYRPAERLLFAKRSEYMPQADYPLGSNLAFYVGPKNYMVEMETMGPVIALKPAGMLIHRETWRLCPSADRAPSAAELRGIFP